MEKTRILATINYSGPTNIIAYSTIDVKTAFGIVKTMLKIAWADNLPAEKTNKKIAKH